MKEEGILLAVMCERRRHSACCHVSKKKAFCLLSCVKEEGILLAVMCERRRHSACCHV